MNLNELIRAALAEDMPRGDITTDSLALGSRQGTARLIAKQDLILSGSGPFEQTMQTLDPEIKIKWSFTDGSAVLKGQTLCVLHGDMIQILKAERVALNFLGHLSGISTLTKKFVEKVSHTKTHILDTRKTLPTYRELEKKAVKDGGGQNHRSNLSDAILIKENHIYAAGTITSAVERIRRHSQLPITVECESLHQVKEAVGLKVNRVMLDNMTNEMMRDALQFITHNIQAEASGNMSLERVASVAELGVHFISVGALTHSAPTADISLLFDWNHT